MFSLDVVFISAEKTLRIVAAAALYDPCPQRDLSQPCSHQACRRIIRGVFSLKSRGRDESGTEALAKQDTLQDLYQPGTMPRFYLQCK